MTDASTIPADWDDVTASWMTAALSRALPGVEVGRVEVLLREDGTNRRARIGLPYERGTHDLPVEEPDALAGQRVGVADVRPSATPPRSSISTPPPPSTSSKRGER